MKLNLHRLIMIALGVLLIACGIHFFLLPSHLSLGGATGMALVLQEFLPLDMGPLLIIVNGFLFALGFLLLGRSFGLYTVAAALSLSGVVWLLDILVPLSAPLVENTWLNLICAVITYGLGVGMVLNQGASTGGSDIIAKIINKHTGLDIGKCCLVTDFVVTLLAGARYSLDIILYCLVGVIINGLIVDYTVDGLNSGKYCIIHTDHPQELCDFLISLGRSATIYEGTGAYSKKTRPVVTTVVKTRDFIRLKQYLREIDHNVFMIVSSVHNTVGWHWLSLDD